MRPKTLILFVIAVGCGLVASIGVSQYMENQNGPEVETEKIFVTAANINIGEKLDASKVILEEWPRDRVPEGAIRELTELEERYPRHRLYAGEPLLQAKLMDSRDRGSKALTIPEGYRVASVKVSVESSVSGLVQPGDRVDLVVFLRKSGEVPETGTRTILRDVNVFSVDGETERKVDEDGQARNVRTVSLLVRPEQAEKVLLASELGQLYLSLRRPDDATDTSGEGVTVNELLGDGSESANEKKKETGDGQDAGFLEWLSDRGQQSAPASGGIDPAWRMTIMTQEGAREYEWQDPDQLPTEVTNGPVASPAMVEPVEDDGVPVPLPVQPEVTADENDVSGEDDEE